MKLIGAGCPRLRQGFSRSQRTAAAGNLSVMANGDDTAGSSDAAAARADAKARVVRTFVEIAPTYGTGMALWDVFGRALVAAVAIQAGDRVLDVACGRGACLRPACEAVGDDGFVLGIDLSPAMVELTAAELRRDAVANAEVREGDVDQLDVADASFDVVTCGFGVFLFPAPEVALGECRRVLRSGGRFGASTFADGMLDYPWLPQVLQQFGLMDALRNRGGTGGPLLRAAGLTQILGACGFVEVSTTTATRRFVFRDLNAYMLWVRSHAVGAVLDRLNERDLTRFARECEQRLQAHRVADEYELIKSVDLTVARQRPSPT
jgi:ubiquinone/menaquinone biosynthesis C-methylase UbiE